LQNHHKKGKKMSIEKAKKTALIKEFAVSDKDNGGSVESQVAVLTERIRNLTEHAKKAPKDKHSQYGMVRMVNARKSLLKYIKSKDVAKYEELIKKLGLRK
jgi:small subunit ribosomal protein S15